MRWVVWDGATALPGSCAWSGSSPGSAPNIERPPPTVVTGGPIAPNRLRNLAVRRSNQVWVSDATAVLTAQGWLCLVVVLDVFTRQVVGWAMSQILDATLVIAALRMALG